MAHTRSSIPFNGNIATPLNGIAAASAYSYRGPEPPHILVPPSSIITAPSFNEEGTDELTEADLRIITKSDFTPVDNSTLWKYEMRRQAQKLLPFLYLGPWEVLKTQPDFIQREGISLLLVVRDRKTAEAGIMNPKKFADAAGIQYGSVDVQDNQELITVFPRATRTINEHLVNIYRQQLQQQFDPASPFRMGKVLLFCESGNDRSAAVAAAYFLSTYKVSLIHTLQYIQAQRFCVSFDEPLKNLLRSYEDIVTAQRSVREAQKQDAQSIAAHQYSLRGGSASHMFGSEMDTNMGDPVAPVVGKRGRSRDEEDAMVDDDGDRFEGRATFQPFH